MKNPTIENRPVVSRAEWIDARKKLLAKEKALTRQRDALAAERRQLPWERMEKTYEFTGPDGKETLAQLFAGRSQLFVYHFMFGPDWEEGCPSCSMLADHVDASAVHLAQRDVTIQLISRAPYEKLAAFQRRMGWKFKWVSSHGSDFNRDFGVTFSPEEVAAPDRVYNYGSVAPFSEETGGGSVFFRDGTGQVFHTYSTYGRGLEPLLVPYFYLDLVPKGRAEEGLPYPSAWFRHHDRYETKASIESTARPRSENCCGGQ